MEVVDSAGCQLEEVILLLLRLWFLLSVAVDGGEAGWILFLKDLSGEFAACPWVLGGWFGSICLLEDGSLGLGFPLRGCC